MVPDRLGDAVGGGLGEDGAVREKGDIVRKIFLTGLVFGMCAFLACSSRYASSQTSDGKPDDKSSESAIEALRGYYLKRDLVTDAQIREAEENLKTLKETRRFQLTDNPERRKLDNDIEGLEYGIKAMKGRTGDAGRAKAEDVFQKSLDDYRAVFERNNADNPKLKEDPALREKMWAEFLWHWVDRFKKTDEEHKANVNRIEFKARVVDLDGNPVPKVKVIFKTSSLSTLFGPTGGSITKVGDEKGEFRVQADGVENISVYTMVAPKGYRYDPHQQHRLLFETIKRPEEAGADKRFPDDGFEKFVLVKDFQRTEKTVENKFVLHGPQKATYSIDMFKMPLSSYEESRLPQDKVPSHWERMYYYLTKLSTKESELPDPLECQGKGDFVVQVFRSPFDKGVGVLRITAIEGAIVKDTRGDYLAPEAGYQPFVEYAFNASKNCVYGLGSAYLKSRNNQVCSWMKISIDLLIDNKEFEDAKIAVHISAIISPTGDRVLTPWGPSYNEEERRVLSKRDWGGKE